MKREIRFIMLFFAMLGAHQNAYPQKLYSSIKYYVRFDSGRDNNNGTSEATAFSTIGKAASIAGPGDTILVHEGVYREWVAPARGGEKGRPVTYLAAPGEKVIISGSEVYSGPWEAVSGYHGVYMTVIPSSFFKDDFDPFRINFNRSRDGETQGQVFVNGMELTEAKPQFKNADGYRRRVIEKTAVQTMFDQSGTWHTPGGDSIYVHLPVDFLSISRCSVEFSVRRHLFAPVRRAQNYIHVNGFIFEHCANDVSIPQVGAVSCRSGQQWLIENNVIRQIKTIGIDCGAEAEDPWTIPDILPEDRFLVSGHHDIFTLSQRRIAGRNLILNNILTDCGQCGIAGLFSDGSKIIGNIVERCGNVVPGFESGGIKIHGLMGGTVEGNLVRDNGAWGIWLDCGFIGSRVTRNVVVNNQTSGIFYECSNGPGLIDNNIVAYNRGDGIYTHDASGVNIANNLIFGNTSFGIYMCVATDRLVPPYYYATGLYQTEISSCSWERIHNNIIIQNDQGAISLPYPPKRAQDNLSDYNLFTMERKGPDFVVNFRNGENNQAEAAADKARQAFEKSGDAGLSSADLVMWKNDKGLSMDINHWRVAAGNDLHSLAGNEIAHLDLQTFVLTLDLDSTFAGINCPSAKFPDVRDFAKFGRKVDKDFERKSLPEDRSCLPGAFQSFKSGKNVIKIWPVQFDRSPMPSEVAVKPDPYARDMKPIPKGSYSTNR